jgi:O-antigen/teichoic acid export membrane protein
VLAWSGDYALYARGYSTTGAAVALVRLVVPFALLIFMARFHPDWLAGSYLIALIGIYVITNLFISVFLRTRLVSLPNWSSLHLYFNSLPLGIVLLSIYMMSLGLMMVVPYFYSGTVVAVSFVGLKFYVLFKGVIRIIHQAFLKDMARYDVCFKVDQLTSLIGFTFLIFILCFPNTFIRLFFGEKYLPAREYFIMLAVASQIYSLFSSLTIKAMFEKKDRLYATISVLSAVTTVAVCVLVSFAAKTAAGVGICLITGEIAFAAGMLYLLKRPSLWKERFLFLSKNLPLLLVPLCLSWWTGDKPAGLIISGAVFALITIMLHHRKFRIAAVG